MNIKRLSIISLVIGLTSILTNAQNVLPNEGNVGIGTIEPTEELDVNGEMRVRALQHAGSVGNGVGIGLRYVMVDETGKFVSGEAKIREIGNENGGGQNTPVPFSCSSSNIILPPNAWKEVSDSFGSWAELCSHNNLKVGGKFTSSSARIDELFSPVINTSRIFDNNDNQVNIESKLFIEDNTTVIGNLTVSGTINSSNLNFTTLSLGATQPTVSHPNFLLSVDGEAVFKSAFVTVDGWADYVFNSDYKLKPLMEVENFIKENNHLPDVPSEKEVLENGVSLGEMDAILLQKIEELTLYMIEVKKENEELKKEVENLKN